HSLVRELGARKQARPPLAAPRLVPGYKGTKVPRPGRSSSTAARGRGSKPPIDPLPLGGGEKEFLANVERALEYIRAGDLYQVVLSQRFELPDCDGFSL